MHLELPEALAICTRSRTERQALSQKIVHGKLYFECLIHDLLAAPFLFMNAADQTGEKCCQTQPAQLPFRRIRGALLL